jgi:hypothetical protein
VSCYVPHSGVGTNLDPVSSMTRLGSISNRYIDPSGPNCEFNSTKESSRRRFFHTVQYGDENLDFGGCCSGDHNNRLADGGNCTICIYSAYFNYRQTDG